MLMVPGVRNGGLSIENNCNIHLTSGKELTKSRLSYLCKQSLTQTCFLGNLCSLICMTWIYLMNQHSALLYVPVVDDVA